MKFQGEVKVLTGGESPRAEEIRPNRCDSCTDGYSPDERNGTEYSFLYENFPWDEFVPGCFFAKDAMQNSPNDLEGVKRR